MKCRSGRKSEVPFSGGRQDIGQTGNPDGADAGLPNCRGYENAGEDAAITERVWIFSLGECSSAEEAEAKESEGKDRNVSNRWERKNNKDDDPIGTVEDVAA